MALWTGQTARRFAAVKRLNSAWRAIAVGAEILRVNVLSIDSMRRIASHRLAAEIPSIGALAAIICAASVFDSQSPYPGYRALVPVIAAAVLIAARGRWINRVLLGQQGMVFIGLISYPLYLWHFPLMAYARTVWFDAVPRWAMLGVIALSILLAWLAYRLVENPVRRGAGNTYKVAALVAGMAVAGLLGLTAVQTNGFAMRIPEAVRGFMLTGEETSAYWRRGSCLLLPDQTATAFANECSGDGRRPLILLWGDSYAAALYPGMNELAAKEGMSVAEYTSSAPPSSTSFFRRDRFARRSTTLYWKKF
jgi:hypothetical protein